MASARCSFIQFLAVLIAKCERNSWWICLIQFSALWFVQPNVNQPEVYNIEETQRHDWCLNSRNTRMQWFFYVLCILWRPANSDRPHNINSNGKIPTRQCLGWTTFESIPAQVARLPLEKKVGLPQNIHRSVFHKEMERQKKAYGVLGSILLWFRTLYSRDE